MRNLEINRLISYLDTLLFLNEEGVDISEDFESISKNGTYYIYLYSALDGKFEPLDNLSLLDRERYLSKIIKNLKKKL